MDTDFVFQRPADACLGLREYISVVEAAGWHFALGLADYSSAYELHSPSRRLMELLTVLAPQLSHTEKGAQR